MRIDKWLWAARFFKTRSLATDAVNGGKVKLNGSATKPARDLHVGDRLEIVRDELRWELVVRDLSDKRGPAPVARLLYEETPESLAAREAAAEVRRFTKEPAADRHGRPTKRDRRVLERFGE